MPGPSPRSWSGRALARVAAAVRGDGGTSIIEVVVATTLLTATLLLTTQAVTSASRATAIGHHRAAALDLGHEQAEALRARPWDSVAISPASPGYRATVEGSPTVAASSGVAAKPGTVVRDGTTYELERSVVWAATTTSAGRVAQAYKRIIVVVSWTDGTTRRSARVETSVAPLASPVPSTAPTPTTTTPPPPDPTCPATPTACLTVVATSLTPIVDAGGAAAHVARWRVVLQRSAQGPVVEGLDALVELPPGFTLASTDRVELTGGATRTLVTDPAAGTVDPTWGTFALPPSSTVAIELTATVPADAAEGTWSLPAAVAFTVAGQATGIVAPGDGTSHDDVAVERHPVDEATSTRWAWGAEVVAAAPATPAATVAEALARTDGTTTGLGGPDPSAATALDLDLDLDEVLPPGLGGVRHPTVVLTAAAAPGATGPVCVVASLVDATTGDPAARLDGGPACFDGTATTARRAVVDPGTTTGDATGLRLHLALAPGSSEALLLDEVAFEVTWQDAVWSAHAAATTATVAGLPIPSTGALRAPDGIVVASASRAPQPGVHPTTLWLDRTAPDDATVLDAALLLAAATAAGTPACMGVELVASDHSAPTPDLVVVGGAGLDVCTDAEGTWPERLDLSLGGGPVAGIRLSPRGDGASRFDQVGLEVTWSRS